MAVNLLVFINYYGKPSETFISDEIAFLRQQNQFNLEILHYGKDIPSEQVYGLRIPSRPKERWVKALNKIDFLTLKSLKYRNGLNGSLLYLIDFFKKYRYDIIYCHFGTNGKLIAQLKELKVIPSYTKLIVRFHGLDMIFKKYPIGFYDILNKHVLQVIVGSQYAYLDLLEYNINKAFVSLNPVGISAENISTSLVSYQENVQGFRIISVGRLIKFKGHLEAIEIIKKLRDRNINICYTIIGSGPLQNEIQERINAYGLQSSVRVILGLPHKETLDKMRKAHLYLYPGKVDEEGRTETQGLANIEAMALGLPIVASKVGGVTDYVLDGITGFLCEPENIEEFAERLQWIIGNYNSDKITEVRRRAIRMVSQNYCQEHLNQQLLEILVEESAGSE